MFKVMSFFLFLSIMLHAEVLQVSPKMQGVSTLSHLSFFEDRSKKMSIEEIKNAPFQTKRSFHLNQGASNSNWWLKIKLENPTDQAIEGVLNFNYGQFDEFQSWQYGENDLLLSHALKGDHHIDVTTLPFSDRSTVDFTIASKSENTLYMKFSYVDYGVMELFHTLWSKEEFVKYQEIRFSMIIGTISALLALLFYNIFIWFILKKIEYFWYDIYLLGVIFSIVSFNQLGSHYLWPRSFFIMEMMPFISMLVFFISFTLFTRAFLDTPVNTPRVDKVLKGFVVFNVLTLLLALLGERHLAIILVQVSSFTFLLFPILAFRLWYNGYKIARGYAIAALITAATVMLSILRFSDLLQTSELVYWLSRVGFIAEGIILSIALADRITILEIDYTQEQNKAKETLQEAKKMLESEVKSRTQELEIQVQRAEKIARTDEMTGIYNRRAFLEEGERLRYEATRYESLFSLMMIDIDYFKNINDSYGHDAGDFVLVCFTKAIQKRLRESDFFARIGGEEFVVLLSHTNASQAYEKASELLKHISALEISYKDLILNVTASIGIAECNDKEGTIYSLLAKADKALYYVKEHGRNGIRICDGNISLE